MLLYNQVKGREFPKRENKQVKENRTMMNIYKVEGYGKHYSTNMMVLGNNFDDAKVVISEQTGIKVEEIEKCFYISLYATI